MRSTMVWFQCEDCGENLKKTNLANHLRVCSAYKLSCIDYEKPFNIIDTFNFLRKKPDLAEAVAAILALSSVIKSSEISTMMELQIELEKTSDSFQVGSIASALGLLLNFGNSVYSNSHVTKDTHKVLLLGFKPRKLGAVETPIMVSPRDLLTSFNPSSDLFVIASIDGRIKIWDAIKGHLQTELFNLPPSPNSPAILAGGHLSLNYTCMKWLHLGSKKKKKIWSSVLVLGTGHGDVLAIDMATKLMKWKLCDCHPGGVSVISFTRHNSSIYTVGVDSMVCQIDPSTGNLLSKFIASTKVVSSLSISEDGKILCVASAQLKTFGCYDHKKIQRFPGHGWLFDA